MQIVEKTTFSRLQLRRSMPLECVNAACVCVPTCSSLAITCFKLFEIHVVGVPSIQGSISCLLHWQLHSRPHVPRCHLSKAKVKPKMHGWFDLNFTVNLTTPYWNFTVNLTTPIYPANVISQNLFDICLSLAGGLEAAVMFMAQTAHRCQQQGQSILGPFTIILHFFVVLVLCILFRMVMACFCCLPLTCSLRTTRKRISSSWDSPASCFRASPTRAGLTQTCTACSMKMAPTCQSYAQNHSMPYVHIAILKKNVKIDL